MNDSCGERISRKAVNANRVIALETPKGFLHLGLSALLRPKHPLAQPCNCISL